MLVSNGTIDNNGKLFFSGCVELCCENLRFMANVAADSPILIISSTKVADSTTIIANDTMENGEIAVFVMI